MKRLERATGRKEAVEDRRRLRTSPPDPSSPGVGSGILHLWTDEHQAWAQVTQGKALMRDVRPQ